MIYEFTQKIYHINNIYYIWYNYRYLKILFLRVSNTIELT